MPTATQPFPQSMTFAEYATLWNSIRDAGPLLLSRQDMLLPDMDELKVEMRRRNEFRAKFSFAVPTVTAVQEVIQFAAGPILEVGAGLGLWAHLIRLENGTIRPTDGGDWFMGEKKWVPIERADAEEAAEHASEPTLLMVWPTQQEPWDARALKKFSGQRFIYIGEDDGGCTGTEEFHAELGRSWALVRTVQIPRWEGMYDAIHFYVRK